MIIHGFTISAFGHCADRRQHDSSKLARSALGYLTSLLESHGNQFQLQIPMKGVGHVELLWSSEHLSSGLASFSTGGELAATDVIVSGINPEADRKALELGQRALRNVCAAADRGPPGEDLVRISDRPSVACIRWYTLDRKTTDLLADMEICLAAAFLERSFRTAALGL